MRIMNQKVEHKKFGMGTIFALKDGEVYVTFEKYSEIRRFHILRYLTEI